MDDLAVILSMFYKRRSARSAYDEYVKATNDSRSHRWFHTRVDLLVARGELLRHADGYERTSKNVDFWMMLQTMSDWFKLETPDRLTFRYIKDITGERNSAEFHKYFRELMDQHNVIAILDFCRTLYEHPKLGLSYIAMQWDMDDPDQKTRQDLLRSIQEPKEIPSGDLH